jgi:hypothetical protein
VNANIDLLLSIAKSWRLALATSSMLPVIMVAGAIMGKTYVRAFQHHLPCTN